MAIFAPINEADKNTSYRVVEGTMGGVVSVSARSERVMSDIWEMLTYAVTYCPDEGPFVFRSVFVRGEDCGSHRRQQYAEVDAEGEVLARFEVSKAIAACKGAEAALEREIEKAVGELAFIAKGRKVVVARGRKIPKGTVGEVRWVGQSQYGTRVGMSVNGSSEMTWIAASNLDVVFSDKDVLAARAEVMESGYGDEAREARAAMEVALETFEAEYGMAQAA